MAAARLARRAKRASLGRVERSETRAFGARSAQKSVKSFEKSGDPQSKKNPVTRNRLLERASKAAGTRNPFGRQIANAARRDTAAPSTFGVHFARRSVPVTRNRRVGQATDGRAADASIWSTNRKRRPDRSDAPRPSGIARHGDCGSPEPIAGHRFLRLRVTGIFDDFATLSRPNRSSDRRDLWHASHPRDPL